MSDERYEFSQKSREDLILGCFRTLNLTEIVIQNRDVQFLECFSSVAVFYLGVDLIKH